MTSGAEFDLSGSPDGNNSPERSLNLQHVDRRGPGYWELLKSSN